MNYPSVTLLTSALCALVSLPLQAIVLKEFKCENSAILVDCTITSEKLAVAKSLRLPVFLTEPTEPVTVPAFIAPDGRVGGSIGGKAQAKKALSDSVKLSEFEGATLLGKTAWCFLPITADSYFYVDPASKPGEGFTAPEASFRFDSANLLAISLLAPATDVDEQPVIKFRFIIDEEGNTTDITALDPRGEPVVKDMLKPSIANFVFTPAALNGKPVATSIILSIKGQWKPEEGEKSQPWFIAEASAQAMPTLSKPFEGNAEISLKAYMTLTNKGELTSVRLAGDTDAGLAILVLNKLRTWKNPAHFEWDCKLPIAVVEMKLTPGASAFTLVGEGRPIAFVAPKMTKIGRFNEHGLAIDSFDSARVTYTIDQTGKVTDFSIVSSTKDIFARKAQSMIEGSEYAPASMEGVAISANIDEQCALKIMEYWRNTESLQW